MTRAIHSQPHEIETIDVTIANSGTVSTAANLLGMRLVGIITPAALTGTELTFQASTDNSTFTAMYDENGAAIAVTVAASRWTVPVFTSFLGVPYLKIVSGSAEAAERTITLIVRPL